MSDFSFTNLTPELILDAIESLGVEVTSGLLALNSYENRVYQFAIENNTRMVAKFYRPNRWTNEQIQEEHDFAFELNDLELPIVAPLKFLTTGQRLTSLHEFKGYRFALFPSVGGREFEVDNLEQLEWMGRLIGRIHASSAKKPFKYRLRINTEEYLDESESILRESPLLPNHLSVAFFAILTPVIECTKVLFNQHNKHTQHIRLHGDCHPGNILWRNGPSVVDLDDCRSGPAIQDLWMMLSGDITQQQIQLETLIEAYEEFNAFDLAELNLIEPLRAMRMVHYMAWLCRRFEDPAFPRAFPWFTEDKYWENQILSLKEQLADLQQPSIKIVPY